MLKLKKIAITGGVASGKSTVCRVFQELGAYVVNADAIVHELLALDTDLGQQVVRLLGTEIVIDGKLNRTAIAEKVFKDSEILHALEKVLHPAVLRKIEMHYQAASKQGSYCLFVVEIPLLFEIGQEGDYDAVIVVLADEAQSRERFLQSGHRREEWARRMKRQLSPALKAKKANYVIHNNGTLTHLREQVIELSQQL